MCGIGGWLGVLPDGASHAARMCELLYHRGPDAQATRSWPDATLVHTRLSIIDLSATGAQPMANEDETIWVVFNGEIYNHRELRKQLQTLGHQFRGHSDTEVLVHLYEEEGTDFLERLRGMFAVAIYDTRNKSLVLGRDRFGIKPLYYAPVGARLMFASEIRALLELPEIDNRPNPQAIHDFAALCYIPAPATFYAGIRALEPGELLEARLDSQGTTYKKSRYHRWSISPDPSLDLTRASELAEDLLTRAVSRQLESEVPLGSLLSGGIDSSLVSLAAQKALSGKLRTFNVRFSDQEYDETWAALAVADHIGSQHETLEMDHVKGSWDHVTRLLTHSGQPFADSSLFAVNAVCKLMRQHVTVALSGDGGDEGFGGYNLYWQIARIARLQQLPPAFWRFGATISSGLSSMGIVPRRLPLRLRDLTGADDTSVVQSMFCWLREQEHEQLCQESDLLPVRRLFERQFDYVMPKDAHRLELLSAQATEANIRLMLPNDFLFKVDTASMLESLEVRVPMLDEDLFAFALGLPHKLKAKGRVSKRVLRCVARRQLPLKVAKKPKKGFGVPVDKWVNQSFKAHLKDVLLGSTRLKDYFRPNIYKPMVEAFCEGRTCPEISRENLYQRIIMLLSLELALSQTKKSSTGSATRSTPLLV